MGGAVTILVTVGARPPSAATSAAKAVKSLASVVSRWTVICILEVSRWLTGAGLGRNDGGVNREKLTVMPTDEPVYKNASARYRAKNLEARRAQSREYMP